MNGTVNNINKLIFTLQFDCIKFIYTQNYAECEFLVYAHEYYMHKYLDEIEYY